jgi:hypothetical protein
MLASSAIGTVMLLLSVAPLSAQQAATATLGEAQLLPGWEWAIGRWEGNLTMVGGSAGNTGLTKEPRLLIIDKDVNGNVTCRFLPVPAPNGPNAGLTKRCVIGPNEISLTASTSAKIELNRSGPDGLQGRLTTPSGLGWGITPGLTGIQVHMNRVR